MQTIELFKANDSLQFVCILLKLFLDIHLQFWIDIIWSLVDQSFVED
jgi:hypothetical protein